MFLIDESHKESTPFLNSNDDEDCSYEGKNMALYEVTDALAFDLSEVGFVSALLSHIDLFAFRRKWTAPPW